MFRLGITLGQGISTAGRNNTGTSLRKLTCGWGSDQSRSHMGPERGTTEQSWLVGMMRKPMYIRPIQNTILNRDPLLFQPPFNCEPGVKTLASQNQ